MVVEKRIFTAGPDDIGLRVDKFLTARMPEFSRSEIQKFDVARINGGPVKFSDKLKETDQFQVSVEIRDKITLSADTDDFICDLDVLYEDDDIIVINKPRGIAMYPGAGRGSGTLVQQVLTHAALSALSGDVRPGVVHRLDKDTSGVVVFAKSDAAFRELVKTFSAHDLTRKYIAFVWGVPNWESADISGNIGRSAKNRQKMTMLKVGGKAARTSVDVMNVWPRDGISEFRCTLLTGRTHQIRVHLAQHGFPVLCDPLYGRGASRFGSVKNPELLDFLHENHGQMLHAEILEFNHPVTGEQMKFRAKPPRDMQDLKSIVKG
jgi:23S rRNA pseudouridine1911/1915/1917 synthase